MCVALALACGSVTAAEIGPALRAQAGTAPQDSLIVFPTQTVPALAPWRADADVLARRTALVDALRQRAEREQAGVRQWLGEHGIAYRAYWIANVIAAPLTGPQIVALAQRSDIERLDADRPVRLRLPTPTTVARASATPIGIPWGLNKIRAPQAWALGVRGQGVVLAGEDTGYQWDHPALKAQYRGWNGSVADHAYNWHDAIHDTGSLCGADSVAPCDDDNHGTHTMGTMLGDDGAGNQPGVAPAARWIGCRNMNAGAGTPARYIECMQWMLAPTDAAGLNPRPDLAPDIVSNSWGCTSGEGCVNGDEIKAAVDNLVAGGVFYVAAAGNGGSNCYGIGDAPAIYASSFVVGATDSTDKVTSFSLRGPVSGGTRPMPDLVAPGQGVQSSIPTDSYMAMSGTSMATPHVAGVAALMMSVNPALKGHPNQVAEILRATAVRGGITDPYNAGCGGLTMADWPNNQAGSGRLDALAAVVLADTIFQNGYDNP